MCKSTGWLEQQSKLLAIEVCNEENATKKHNESFKKCQLSDIFRFFNNSYPILPLNKTQSTFKPNTSRNPPRPESSPEGTNNQADNPE